ncbi:MULTISPECIES: hypothetical protein [Streptomyces]|uniref:Uncharacterized protein n=1 Tax=Streptomyces fradiae TaxID=1906 RepID=A0ACC4WBH8_STRFR|nr:MULTISPECIES: hypothetical protein [Streptomyces]KNE81872.1 hypothetical protein ADZ36_13965 [Streptomyces fradiae]OFA61431.1 hypothetical protein BEN35_01260 [Streptomyces fradiae]
MSPEFLITSFVIVVSPGTGALHTIATVLHRGFRQSVVAAFGCTLGIVPRVITRPKVLAWMRRTFAAFVGIGAQPAFSGNR